MVATLTASVTQRRPRSAILHHCVAAAAAGAQRTDGTRALFGAALALTIQSASRISGQRAVDSTTCIAVGDVALIGFGFCSM